MGKTKEFRIGNSFSTREGLERACFELFSWLIKNEIPLAKAIELTKHERNHAINDPKLCGFFGAVKSRNEMRIFYQYYGTRTSSDELAILKGPANDMSETDILMAWEIERRNDGGC
jgi:hypothetical protein